MPQSDQTGKQAATPENRLGLDYRAGPAGARFDAAIIDCHAHIHAGPQSERYFEAAAAYGVSHVISMSPLADAAELRERYGSRISFNAIPNWRQLGDSDEARRRWIADLAAFRELGARICKLWMAPPMRQRHGWTAEHPWLRPVVDAARELGFHFMIHVGDPTIWFAAGARYADASVFGTKEQQYPQLEWLADYVAPQMVVAAHMGGNVEDCDFLERLLDAHANLRLDSSATKWIVREVSRRPQRVREFLIRNADRVLFGSDIVASPNFDSFDHFASRYWAQRTMWESGYRGESPIDDPDADEPPRLAGLDLPAEALSRLYRENVRSIGLAD